MKSYGKWIAAAIAIVALIAIGREAGPLIQSFAAWVEGLGVWAPIVFIAGYVVAVASLIPGSFLTVAGGAIFGLVEGTLYVFIAAVLGSVAGFLIARYVARERIEQRIESDPRFSAIDHAVASNGLKIVFLLRLSPVFPFSFLNYALGLTRVSLRDYLPGTLLYVYYGKLAGDVASAASATQPDGGADLLVSGLGLVATIAVTVFVTRIARRALDEATDSGLSAAPAGGAPAPEEAR